MASGNLQRSIIWSISFSIIKIPVSSSKYALYFCFSSSVMSFVFFPQYFLILFKAISQIFECFICVLRSLTFCHNSIISSFLLQYFTVLIPHFLHLSFVIFTTPFFYFLFFIFLNLWFYIGKSHNFIFFIFTS